MNDNDREQWIANDEGLYAMWKQSGKSLRAFIRENRVQLDEIIDNMRTGKHRQHYLKYGG